MTWIKEWFKAEVENEVSWGYGGATGGKREARPTRRMLCARARAVLCGGGADEEGPTACFADDTSGTRARVGGRRTVPSDYERNQRT
ncbi:hypothetical protein BHE74_00000848 [Ensete ventricosum]|nr:hypothetical protein BHE74_00000848 [Ensete ventricosum]